MKAYRVTVLSFDSAKSKIPVIKIVRETWGCTPDYAKEVVEARISGWSHTVAKLHQASDLMLDLQRAGCIVAISEAQTSEMGDHPAAYICAHKGFYVYHETGNCPICIVARTVEP
jgi:hypothetical protein